MKLFTVISALGISAVANDIGLLLGYISPPRSDVSRLIYIYVYDCMINAGDRSDGFKGWNSPAVGVGSHAVH